MKNKKKYIIKGNEATIRHHSSQSNMFQAWWASFMVYARKLWSILVVFAKYLSAKIREVIARWMDGRNESDRKQVVHYTINIDNIRNLRVRENSLTYEYPENQYPPRENPY